jgi:hypothetical protein
LGWVAKLWYDYRPTELEYFDSCPRPRYATVVVELKMCLVFVRGKYSRLADRRFTFLAITDVLTS